MGQVAKTHLYTPANGKVTEAPTLGDPRSKILLLEDFSSQNPGYIGLPWNSPNIVVADSKLALGTPGSNAKWDIIHWNLQLASKEKNNKLYVTQTGVNLGSTPIKAATGKTIEDKGFNDRLVEYLNAGKVTRTGVLAMDFPGKKLVEQIIKLNYAQRS
ncbi:hypothetical protein BROUX41_002139 [Berkeleyomyces rouxiae]|uniref:uncharacterized protein n=1 Tax=Berkeleyomyces rouxiae TaxID=2035830 RepID=UPI003B796403